VVGVHAASEFVARADVDSVSQACGVVARHVALCVAPAASVAGNLRIAARSVETAMHKLYVLGFDIARVESGCGWVPLPPVAGDDLTAIGRTNDAILYGGRITLMVCGDDKSLEEVGRPVPSSSSQSFGRHFLELFEEAGRDFYKMDPKLFSPAEVVFHNIETG